MWPSPTTVQKDWRDSDVFQGALSVLTTLAVKVKRLSPLCAYPTRGSDVPYMP